LLEAVLKPSFRRIGGNDRLLACSRGFLKLGFRREWEIVEVEPLSWMKFWCKFVGFLKLGFRRIGENDLHGNDKNWVFGLFGFII